MLKPMKKLSIIIALFISVSAMATPNTAEAWIWFVVKKAFKSSKPTPKKEKDWWANEGKYSKGWSADETDPDYKLLNYREKDWYK